MIKKLFCVLILGLFACGGYDDAQEEELVQAGAFLKAPTRGPVATYGTRTSNTAENCTNDSTSQTCLVPKTKALRYAVECTGCIASDLQFITNAAARAMTRITGAGVNTWGTPTKVQTDATPLPQFVFRATSVGGSGGSSIQNYVTLVGQTPTNLTEAAGVVGNYQSSSKIFINLDIADIKALGTSTVRDQLLSENLALNGLMKAMGVGGFPQDNFRCTSAPVPGVDHNKDNVNCIISSSEVCALNGFSINDTTTWSNSATNCGF